MLLINREFNKNLSVQSGGLLILNDSIHSTKYLFHSSVILNSSVPTGGINNVVPVSLAVQKSTLYREEGINNSTSTLINELISNSEVEDLSKSLVKYVQQSEGLDLTSPYGEDLNTYKDHFPWLANDDGTLLDFNKSISLFDGVDLVSKYLELKYNIQKEDISEVKLTEIIQIFQDEQSVRKEVRIIDLYNHVSKFVLSVQTDNKDHESFLKNLLDNDNINEEVKENVLNNLSKNPKPLGELGDITLNDVANELKELKWDIILNNTQITLNALPIVVQGIGFGLVLRSYIKLVHKRPFPPKLSDALRLIEQRKRDKQLVYFALFGVPFVMFGLKFSGLALSVQIVCTDGTSRL